MPRYKKSVAERAAEKERRDKIPPVVREWQSRSLEDVYAVVLWMRYTFMYEVKDE